MNGIKNKITAIVAMGDDWEIGRNGQLLWRIKEDLQRFKRMTMGHPVVMGRKTWESLPKALPGRTNIVVTRNPEYVAEGAVVAGSLEEALEKAARAEGGEETFIIGGGEIYAQAMPLLDAIEVTHVYEYVEDADTFFPRFNPDAWRLIEMTDLQRMPDGLEFGFESYVRDREEEK